MLFRVKISQRRFCLKLYETTAKHAVLFISKMWLLKEDRKRLVAQHIGLLGLAS